MTIYEIGMILAILSVILLLVRLLVQISIKTKKTDKKIEAVDEIGKVDVEKSVKLKAGINKLNDIMKDEYVPGKQYDLNPDTTSDKLEETEKSEFVDYMKNEFNCDVVDVPKGEGKEVDEIFPDGIDDGWIDDDNDDLDEDEDKVTYMSYGYIFDIEPNTEVQNMIVVTLYEADDTDRENPLDVIDAVYSYEDAVNKKPHGNTLKKWINMIFVV